MQLASPDLPFPLLSSSPKDQNLRSSPLRNGGNQSRLGHGMVICTYRLPVLPLEQLDDEGPGH